MDSIGRAFFSQPSSSDSILWRLGSLALKVGAVALASGLTCKLLGWPKIVMISASGLAFLYFVVQPNRDETPPYRSSGYSSRDYKSSEERSSSSFNSTSVPTTRPSYTSRSSDYTSVPSTRPSYTVAPQDPAPRHVRPAGNPADEALIERFRWEQEQTRKGISLPTKSKQERESDLDAMLAAAQRQKQQALDMSFSMGSPSRSQTRPSSPQTTSRVAQQSTDRRERKQGSTVDFLEAAKRRTQVEKQKYEEREAIRIENDKTFKGKVSNFLTDLGI